MTDTHEVLGSRAFFHFGLFTADETVRRVPVLGRIPSQEIEPPFRRANSFFFRFPFTTFGIIFGWWKDTDLSEEEAILLAMSGYGLDLYDEDLENDDTRDLIRRNIADNVEDIDDEWQIVQALGLDVD